MSVTSIPAIGSIASVPGFKGCNAMIDAAFSAMRAQAAAWGLVFQEVRSAAAGDFSLEGFAFVAGSDAADVQSWCLRMTVTVEDKTMRCKAVPLFNLTLNQGDWYSPAALLGGVYEQFEWVSGDDSALEAGAAFVKAVNATFEQHLGCNVRSKQNQQIKEMLINTLGVNLAGHAKIGATDVVVKSASIIDMTPSLTVRSSDIELMRKIALMVVEHASAAS